MERKRIRRKRKKQSALAKVWRSWKEYYGNNIYDKAFAFLLALIVVLVAMYFFGFLEFLGLKYEPPPPPPPTIETTS